MSRRAAVVVDVRSARGLARNAPFVRRAARAALAALGERGCEVSLLLVGDEEMRALNRDWRGRDRTTDVLSFSQLEGDAGPAPEGRPLGDVVLSLPTAARQAAARGRPLEAEVAELVVHGLLHLLGWDHERSTAEARRMFARQRAILAELAAVLPGISSGPDRSPSPPARRPVAAAASRPPRRPRALKGRASAR